MRFKTKIIMWHICSCLWGAIPGHRRDVQEHSGSGKAPGGGASKQRRSLRLLPLQLRRLSGHAIHPLPPPVLPRVRHLRHSRLCVWQRRCHSPELQPLRSQTPTQPKEHLHSPRPNRSQPEHWDFHS